MHKILRNYLLHLFYITIISTVSTYIDTSAIRLWHLNYSSFFKNDKNANLPQTKSANHEHKVHHSTLKFVLHEYKSQTNFTAYKYKIEICKSTFTQNCENLTIKKKKKITFDKSERWGISFMYNHLRTIAIIQNIQFILKLSTSSWKDMCYAISVSCEHRTRAWHIKKLLNSRHFLFLFFQSSRTFYIITNISVNFRFRYIYTFSRKHGVVRQHVKAYCSCTNNCSFY